MPRVRTLSILATARASSTRIAPRATAGALLLLGANLFACARSTTTPSQTAVTPKAPMPVPTVPVEPIDTAQRTSAQRMPAFRALPLVTWGNAPVGDDHPPLPARSADLLHQITNVRFDWSRKAVVGSTTLRFTALDPSVRTIALDAVGMTVARVTSVSTKKTLPHTYNGNVLTVTLARAITPNDTIAFTVDYETIAPKKGAYFIDRKHVMWTQGEMIDTRYWVPTVDRPDEKTTWEFFVTVPPNEKVLSNGRLVGVKTVGANKEWHWAQELPASTYHFSVVTGNYTLLTDAWDGIPVSLWTYPDSVEAGKRGFAGTTNMMAIFSRKTGVRYPWAKYDQSVVPDFIFGGMENVTATTQNDRRLLIPAADSLRDAQDLVSHELAHQWFGNIVTLRDWSHAWLNEGFATFLETIYFEESGQTERAALNRLKDQEQALRADLRARRPLVFGRWSKDPVELFLSGHIYPKGAAVLDMLRVTVGDSLFWASINRYLTTHAYGSVVSDDLRDAFEQTTGRDLKPFFAQWVYGAGYPAFRIGYAYDSTAQRVTITAMQVQPRDSLTGLFTMDVDVDVLTAAGPVRGVAQVRGETTTLVIPVTSAPLAIRWDPADRWLDVIDFPRPTAMLQHQLAHGDVLARIEAIGLLRERLTESGVREALQRAADQDPSRTVRARAKAAIE